MDNFGDVSVAYDIYLLGSSENSTSASSESIIDLIGDGAPSEISFSGFFISMRKSNRGEVFSINCGEVFSVNRGEVFSVIMTIEGCLLGTESILGSGYVVIASTLASFDVCFD